MKLCLFPAVLPCLADTQQFEALVREHQAAVFRTLTRLTGTREHVEDLAQEVFLRLFRAFPTFEGRSMLSTYLYRITVNVAQDEWKRRRREDQPLTSLSEEATAWQERLPHPSPNAEQQLRHQEFQIEVEDELQKLHGIERTVLVLYHQEELSYQQIAETLHLPIGTVRTHLHRGRQKMRSALRERGRVR